MRTVSVLIVSCLIIAVSAFTEKEYQDAFTKWMIEHNKSYSADDFKTRYGIFRGHLDFITQHNEEYKAGKHTFYTGLNHLCDMTVEEYRNTMLGAKVDPANCDAPRPFVALEAPAENHTVGTTGDVINWGSKGGLVPIKNQGQCGSCWTFGTAAALETLNWKWTGHLNSLSEQNILDCSQGTAGCNGGDPKAAFQYIINNHGVDTEGSYPYEAQKGNCRFNSANTGAAMGGQHQTNSGDENDLANNVNNGVVQVTIDASSQQFQVYAGGIFSVGGCRNDVAGLDHAVAAIGYGSQGGDYWIVRNSWGLGWGMKGYIWMARNAGNMCGIATYANVPIGGTVF